MRFLPRTARVRAAMAFSTVNSPMVNASEKRRRLFKRARVGTLRLGLCTLRLGLFCASFAHLTATSAHAAETAPTANAAAAKADLVARGRVLFDDQQYEESIQVLSAALLRPGKSKAQTLDIYRYLALNYITLNRREEAESAVRGLLAQEPTYALAANESPRFRDFFAATRSKWEAEGRPGLVVVAAPVAARAVTLRHSGPTSQDERAAVDLTVRVDDPDMRVAAVKLFYRSGSRGRFESRALDLPAGAAVDAAVDAAPGATTAAERSVRVQTRIPSTAVRAPLLEYYFTAYDAGGLPLASRGDATDPLRVAVAASSRGWVLPVVIGGSVLGAAAVVGGLALAGVFKSSATATPAPGTPRSTVTVIVGD
jgi:tetratricopeptide (TPR) repeat protein